MGFHPGAVRISIGSDVHCLESSAFLLVLVPVLMLLLLCVYLPYVLQFVMISVFDLI